MSFVNGCPAVSAAGCWLQALNEAFCLLTGVNIEMLGRRALWEVGLNYGHGTGHGVGNYFGVHECMGTFLF